MRQHHYNYNNGEVETFEHMMPETRERETKCFKALDNNYGSRDFRDKGSMTIALLYIK